MLGSFSLTRAQKVVCAGCDVEKSRYLPTRHLCRRPRDSSLAGHYMEEVRECA